MLKEFVLRRLGAALLLLTVLSACASMQGLQASADRNILSYTVGKPYTQIAQQGTSSLEGMMGQEKAYGHLVSSTELANGDRLYRHASAYAAETSSTDFIIVGSNSARYDYRLFYFRVDGSGMVRDYANGVVSGSQTSCISYVGGIVKSCEDATLISSDISKLDAQVVTSAGAPVSSWM